jgi:hypothetical protein
MSDDDLLADIIAKLAEAKAMIQQYESNHNRGVIVVLDDNETFAGGCQFILVPDGWETERTEAVLRGDPEIAGDLDDCVVLCEF